MWIIPLLILFGGIIFCIVMRFKFQIAMLCFSILPYILWIMFVKDTPGYVSIFSIEGMLLSKLMGMDNSFISAEISAIIVVLVYLNIVVFSKLSKWTMAAGYGCVVSIGFSSLIEFIDALEPTNQFPRAIVFIVTLMVTLISMYTGFHSFDLWIGPERKILGLIMGIIPAFICIFITWCNIFTVTFGIAVEDKAIFVILSILFDIVMLGVGIFLYFRFNWKYWKIMMKKLGIEEEGYTVETKVLFGGDNTEE